MTAMEIVQQALWPAVMGILAGGLSTGLYWLTSPQGRLEEIGNEVAETRLSLRQYDGTDIRCVLGMTGHALGLSFRQLGLMMGPAILAVLPVLTIAWCVGVLHAAAWLPASAFWTSICVSAIGLRVRFKIK